MVTAANNDCCSKNDRTSNDDNDNNCSIKLKSATEEKTTASSTLHDTGSTSVSHWAIGSYEKDSNYVTWKPLPGTRTANDAHDIFRNHTSKLKKRIRSRPSMVLFNTDKGTPASFWSVHSEFDIAIILYAFKQHQQQQNWQEDQKESKEEQQLGNPSPSPSNVISTSRTLVDRSQVEQLVQGGYLPLVPTTQSRPVQEWLLKRSVDYAFSRSSVKFFACSPYRYGRSLYYFDMKTCPNVKGHVALTIDDAPCRLSYPGSSQFSNVLDILHEYNAHATFMIIGHYVARNNDKNEQDLIYAVQKGHELGNHGMMDRPYHKDEPTDFAQAVDECNGIIQRIYDKADTAESKNQESSSFLPEGSSFSERQPQQDEKNDNNHDDQQKNKVKWFRAPHGKYTKEMEQVLMERSLRNVMCDTYASCPIIQDGMYIGTSLAQKCTHGSILLLHMPEVGFREWCLVALQQLMRELFQRGLQAVTVSELERLAAGA